MTSQPDQRLPEGRTASELFRSADKTQQEIVKAVLNEERQVMHQRHRTRIFDNIVGIIKEHVQ